MSENTVNMNQTKAALDLQIELRKLKLQGETHFEGVEIDTLLNEIDAAEEAAKPVKEPKDPVVERLVRSAARTHRRIRETVKKKEEAPKPEVVEDDTPKLSFWQKLRLRRQIKTLEIQKTALELYGTYKAELDKE